MWLVKQSDPKPGPHSVTLPTYETTALKRAYEGNANKGDVEAAIRVVHQARTLGYWIACDCRKDESRFPLLSPAYLSDHRRYYLRRMTGPDRPEHDDSCPFRFERPEAGLDALDPTPAEASYSKKPNGYFSVLKKEDAHSLTSAETKTHGTTDKVRSAPALARQLWRLMDDAKLNVLEPIQASHKPSIRAEFAALTKAASSITVSTGIQLDQVLATYVEDYHSKRLFARIREAAMQTGEARPLLQGFLLTYAPSIQGNTVRYDRAEPIMVSGDLSKPTIGDSDRRAPFLTIIVIGDHRSAGGLVPLRGYAQPIYSGSQFVPVDSDFERQCLVALNRVRWSLVKSHPKLGVRIIKPLFAINRGEGECLPDFVLEIFHIETGQIHELVIEAMGYDNNDYYDAKARTHPLMATIGPVHTITPVEIGNKAALDDKLRRAITSMIVRT